MSELQDAFLFDYLGFQHAAQPIVRALDEGDLQPLIRRTTQIRREIGASETWILQDRGTELSSLERLQYKGVTADTIAQWGGPGVLQGHDLLLLLSSFLSPAISLGYDQPLLAHALEQMGWGDTEIDLIRQGWSTAVLVKPDQSALLRPLLEEPHADYWNFIAPYHVSGSGWLPIEEIRRLRERLMSGRERIRKLREWIRLPGSVAVRPPPGYPQALTATYWYQRIPVAYEQAIAMLSQALDAEKGLYFVLTIS